MGFWQRRKTGDTAADYAWAHRPAGGAPLAAPLALTSLSGDFVAWDELGAASDAWRVADGAPGSPFDAYRGKFLPLPDWFDASLDPLGPEYLAQQDRLWRAMIGADADYEPDRDEQSGVDDSDALVRPGFYRDSLDRAGDHIIAMGHIVQRCGLKPGDRVLEYGAGFGQIALTLARLGLTVDTIDVDPGFCSAVQKQADWFGVELSAHHGRFGDNPSGQRYAMILFYEAFHHARNFRQLIAKAREMLVPGGKIVMAGEPIEPADNAGFAKICPYPWGMRLDIENAAIVRFRRWYELGFREEFLFETFDAMGFTPRKFAGQISHYATVYTFTLRPDENPLAQWSADEEIMSGWHGPEPEGRWSTAAARFPLGRRHDRTRLRIACTNHHPCVQTVEFAIGETCVRIAFEPHEEREVVIRIAPDGAMLRIATSAIKPSSYGIAGDERDLGIFVKSIAYLE